MLRPRRFGDHRGFFCEVYQYERHAKALEREVDFLQDNCSFSSRAGTVRGLHFQAPPGAQAKLVSVFRGAILDVAVDVRRGSPSFGRHVAVRLTADGGEQLFIPEGFAHGFCTLEPDTLVHYKVSRYFEAALDFGVFWQDPDLSIAWPVAATDAVLSEKDRGLPRLSQLPAYFL
jgi:dTDP-4-dehydrorhamnose 3,5-epimerase